MELVFEPTEAHVVFEAEAGNTITLERRPDSDRGLEELASALRGSGVEEVEVNASEDALIVHFETTEARRLARAPRALGFELGPYSVAEATSEAVVLSSRGPGAIDTIEVIAVPAAEQWRRLMARDVDVAPNVPSNYQLQFDGMESVRIIELPSDSSIALYVNPRSQQLGTVEARRALFGLIDSEAIAAEACGDQACVVASAPLEFEGGEFEGSAEPLELLVLASDTETITAARVIRHQLHRAGIAVEIEAAELSELVSQIMAGDYDLALAPSQSGGSIELIITQVGFWGWRDEALLDALTRSDLAAARARLASQAYSVDLFQQRAFAAVDASWCGGEPKSAVSWEWLADLYPCEQDD